MEDVELSGGPMDGQVVSVPTTTLTFERQAGTADDIIRRRPLATIRYGRTNETNEFGLTYFTYQGTTL